MYSKNLKDIQTALLNGDYTVEDLLVFYLDNIAQQKEHNAYVQVFKDEALFQAQALDKKIKSDSESLGSLFGAVISIKDNLCYKGHSVTAGSKMLHGFVSPYSSTVVERLIQSDAIIIGTTNCDEFSMGSTNETSFYGPVLNAVSKEHTPGGSTGGGAVAVKLNTCLISIGSDTGGSIRQPGAFNGIVGYKPSYGLVSRYGLIAYGSTFDQVGTLSHNVDDAARVLSVIAGPDEFDSTLNPDAAKNFSVLDCNLKEIKIGYIENMLNHEKIDSVIKEASFDFIEILRSNEVEVTATDFSLTDFLVPTYYILTAAEASSNLSRFDGVRYGHRSDFETDDYREMIRHSRTEGFGFEVKKRIMLGTYVLSEGYYDAYFKKAQQVRKMINDEVQDLFRKYDFILLPTTTGTAWKLGERDRDPMKMYMSDVFTVMANLCGIPAISLPLKNKSGHLPLGIQLIGAQNNDKSLLAFAKQIANLA